MPAVVREVPARVVARAPAHELSRPAPRPEWPLRFDPDAAVRTLRRLTASVAARDGRGDPADLHTMIGLWAALDAHLTARGHWPHAWSRPAPVPPGFISTALAGEMAVATTEPRLAAVRRR